MPFTVSSKPPSALEVMRCHEVMVSCTVGPSGSMGRPDTKHISLKNGSARVIFLGADNLTNGPARLESLQRLVPHSEKRLRACLSDGFRKAAPLQSSATLHLKK